MLSGPEGGTEFRFVNDIHDALKRGTDAAGSQDIRIGGGVSTIRQDLEAGLVDEMYLAIAPVLLGSGEHLRSGVDLPALGYERTNTFRLPVQRTSSSPGADGPSVYSLSGHWDHIATCT